MRQIKNPEEREGPRVEAVNRRLVKNVSEDTSVCLIAICKV
jgi:hypothetical protein